MNIIKCLILFFFPLLFLPQECFPTEEIKKIVENIKYGYGEKKLNAIRSLHKLPQKNIIELLPELLSDPDPAIRKTTLQQVKFFSPEILLPKIYLMLLDPKEDVSNEVKQYIIYHKNNDFVFNFIKEKILSDVDPQIVHQLILLLYLFPETKVFPIIEQIYQKSDILRYAVAKLLSEYKTVDTLNKLIEYLNDEVPEIQFESVKSLIARKEYPVILLILPLVENKFIGEDVTKLLSSITEQESYYYFYLGLTTYKSKSIKHLCINQLGKSKDIKYLPVLLELYKITNEEKTLEILKSSIEQFNIKEAEHIFIRALYEKKLRSIAIDMLIKLNSISAIPFLVEIYLNLDTGQKNKVETFITSVKELNLLPYFITKIKTVQGELKLLIIKTISNYDNPLVYSYLEKEILTTKNKFVIETIIKSLPKIVNHEKKIFLSSLLFKRIRFNRGLLVLYLSTIKDIIKGQEIKSVLLIPEIVSCLNVKDEILKSLSYEIVRIFLTEETAEFFYPLLKNSPVEIQRILIVELTKFPQEKFLPEIKSLFYSTNDTEVKILLCEYLASFPYSYVSEIFLSGLKNKDEKLILTILDTISENISYSELDKILFLLYHKNHSIRMKTAQILSRLATEKEIVYVHQLIKDKFPEIQIIGLKIIKKFPTAETLYLCKLLLNSSYEPVRKEAIITLRNFSQIDETIIKHIILIATKDSSIPVRGEALLTLGELKIKTEPVIKLYFQNLYSYEPELRKSAEECLKKVLTNEDEEIFVRGLVSEKSYIRKFFISRVIELQPVKSTLIKEKLKHILLFSPDDEEKKLTREALSKIFIPEDVNLIEEIYNTGNVLLKCWVLKELPKFPIDKIEHLLITALKENQSIVRKTAVEISKNFISIGKLKSKLYYAISYIAENDTEYDIRKLAKTILSEVDKK